MSSPAVSGATLPELPRPAAGPPRPYRFPHYERSVMPNGVTLLVAPIHTLPVVTVDAVIEAGAMCDPPGLEGVASLTARALVEGTTRATADEITDRLESRGTALSGGAGWDTAVLGMTVLREHLADALATFAEVLVTPSFPAHELERLKRERLAELLQVESDPRELADEKFSEYIYERSSRYHAPLGGSRTSVGRLARETVAAFHATAYTPAATTLIVTGDVTAREIETLAGELLGGWSGPAPAVPIVADTPAHPARSIRIVHREDAPQSEVRLGHIGVPRSHGDYFAITVMNALLGGLFSSRINLNLREAHGYTYGASSWFDWRRAAGPFVISTAVASDVTGAAVAEVLVEIDRMRSERVSDSELSLAVDYLDGVFPIRFETTTGVASALSTLVEFGLPDDWYDGYRERVRAVTSDDVLRAAREHLHPDRARLLVVGDAGAVRPQLEQISFGPVDIVTPRDGGDEVTA